MVKNNKYNNNNNNNLSSTVPPRLHSTHGLQASFGDQSSLSRPVIYTTHAIHHLPTVLGYALYTCLRSTVKTWRYLPISAISGYVPWT